MDWGREAARATGQLSRRRLFAVGAGAAFLAGCQGASAPATTSTTAAKVDMPIERWRAERGKNFLIAHRGAGDVVPEHTLEAYQAALAWGARAIEVSVVRSADGVLYCHHDLTLDRTTNLKGPVVQQTAADLDRARVTIPRLGPHWQGAGAPRLPRLEQVLDRLGRQAVLLIEPKDNAAYPDLIALIKAKGLEAYTIIKLHHPSPRIDEAIREGFAVFAYVGNTGEFTAAALAALTPRLDRDRDVLVVPAFDGLGQPIPDSTLALATDSGIPSWVFPLHRRWELDHYFSRGFQAAVVSSYVYLARAVPPLQAPEWLLGRLGNGEMTRFPEVDSYGLQWPEPGVISLAMQKRQAFLTLGQLAPPDPKGSYRIQLEIRVDETSVDGGANFTLAFGHEDDRYYEHKLGVSDGYHALLRLSGDVELRTHLVGQADGALLGNTVSGPPPSLRQWVPLELTVDGERLTWRRVDTGSTVVARDTSFRGSYLHIGRSSLDGQLSVRNLRIDR